MPKRKAEEVQDEDEPLYCHCRKPEKGFMIYCNGCSNWYHGRCVNMNSSSSKKFTKWFCKACSSPMLPSSFSKSIEELRQEIKQVKAELRAEFHLDRDRLQKEVVRMQEENVTLTAALNQGESENQNLQNNLEQEKEAHQGCCKQNDSLKQQFERVQEENIKLTRALSQIKDEYRNLQNDFQQKNAQGCCQDKDELKRVQENNVQLINTLKFKESDIHNLIITLCQKSLDEVHQTSAQKKLEMENKNLKDEVCSLNRRSRLSLKSSQER